MQTALTQLSDTLAEVVERVSASTVVIEARPRISSSGVLWSPGVVVTADHTIQHDDILVRLSNGNEVKAALAGRDRATDLAVLRVETDAAPPAFCDPKTLKAGHVALLIGRTEQGVTATMGIVSTVGGAWRTWRGGLIDRFIRLDVALYASSSGAAVVNAEGEVFGIATSGLSRTSAIAIPKTTIDVVVDELLRRGRIARGYLGIGLQPVSIPEHLKNKLQLSQEGGVIVLSVEPGGPADSAGLMIGDVLLKLNGLSLADTDEVQTALGAEAVGNTVKLELVRGGEVRAVEATIGERPRKE
jgi:S1-C subfamily serine protease